MSNLCRLEVIEPLRDRMPVLLFENDWDKGMAGSFGDLLAFQARKRTTPTNCG